MPNTMADSTETLMKDSNEVVTDEIVVAGDEVGAEVELGALESEASETESLDASETDSTDVEDESPDADASLESLDDHDSMDDDAELLAMEGEAPEEVEEEGIDDADERTEEELANELLALIFASPDPLSTGRLSKLLGLKGKRKVLASLDVLALRLADQGLPLVLRSVAGGWRLFTRPEMGELLSGLTERKPDRISPAALETLAIVAYRQPVSKAEIEAIRGVGSGPILRALVDRRLAKVTGRADQPGSPLLYGTTREFLERFGLDSPADLPRDGELARD
ncbi:MAG: segregation and condensation protein B [Planctomycetota bacterium]|jgi:segregation and condensation protein B